MVYARSPIVRHWKYLDRFHAALPHFRAVVVQAIGTRCHSVAAASTVAASDRRSASELFSLASHFGPDAIGQLEISSYEDYPILPTPLRSDFSGGAQSTLVVRPAFKRMEPGTRL
jgi:hypothetical protein